MHIAARILNAQGSHQVSVETDGRRQSLAIPPKPNATGSAVNGGELLFLALATCYCNDVYREAGSRGITVRGIEIEVSGDFGGRGEPVSGITYRARVDADASAEEISALLHETDLVAEIHNTLRTGCAVTFAGLLPADR
jgi:uncharacterized OsmC-like protein